MWSTLFGGMSENWYLIVNTAFTSPKDFNNLDVATKVIGLRYRLEPRAAVILMTKRD